MASLDKELRRVQAALEAAKKEFEEAKLRDVEHSVAEIARKLRDADAADARAAQARVAARDDFDRLARD